MPSNTGALARAKIIDLSQFLAGPCGPQIDARRTSFAVPGQKRSSGRATEADAFFLTFRRLFSICFSL